MISKEYLQQIFQEYHFSLSEEQALSFERYAGLLTEWNEKINLTSILEPKEICIKHFLDSVLLLDAAGGMEKETLIDVGTGAGFPSVPCKIMRPELKLTLLDSLQKRIHFLSVLSDELGQDNHCVHGRAEELGRKAENREQFDFATARAVAHLRELSEYCLPFVKTGGCFAALKGYEIDDELEESKKAIKVLGGEIQEVRRYSLPEGNKRAIIVIRKISQTPTKYPRNAGKMRKQPIT